MYESFGSHICNYTIMLNAYLCIWCDLFHLNGRNRKKIFIHFSYICVIDLRVRCSINLRMEWVEYCHYRAEMNIADFCVNTFCRYFSFIICNSIVNVVGNWNGGKAIKMLNMQMWKENYFSNIILLIWKVAITDTHRHKLYQCLLIPSADSIIRLMRLSFSIERHFSEESN